MKTVPLSTVFLLLRDIAYKMRQIDVDELDADYEQHLQRERDKPPESHEAGNQSVSDGKDNKND